MSALPLKRFRITVIERLSHDASSNAPDAEAAEAEARRLWDTETIAEIRSPAMPVRRAGLSRGSKLHCRSAITVLF
jgi:hypothetical protein